MTDAGRRMVALTALIEGMTIREALSAAGLALGDQRGALGSAFDVRDEAGHLRATWSAADTVQWARARPGEYGCPPPALEPCACVLP